MTEFKFADDPDRVIHEPARLKIMAVLSVAESADFMYLMGETGLTRGNLSVQLTRLKAFDEYRVYLASILQATAG